FEVVAPDETAELLERLPRIVRIEPHAALGIAQLRVGLLEHGAEQLVLAAEVVIDHALARARALRDAFAACAGVAVPRELGARRLQDPCARRFGIAAARRRLGCCRLRRHRGISPPPPAPRWP